MKLSDYKRHNGQHRYSDPAHSIKRNNSKIFEYGTEITDTSKIIEMVESTVRIFKYTGFKNGMFTSHIKCVYQLKILSTANAIADL